ncbi:MAG: 2-oxoacid:acceptor oxidoreductase family protein [bacterium]
MAKQDIIEIRWHGRGGQGAKTAALLFADAALSEGKYIQAFPEYGPERMGAPVQSFNRISDEPITLHCAISNPKYVVVLDPTLINKVNVLAGVPEDGKIIINTGKTPDEIKKELKIKGIKVYTIDASKIAKETIGRDIPNTPMLGAMAAATGLLNFERLLKDLEQKLKKKFASKQEIIAGNLTTVKRAYEEVKK